MKRRERGSVLAEAALTIPVMLLLTLGLVNLALYGFAAVNAANAARYGARAGSVAQGNAAAVAQSATWAALNAAPVGTYTVQVYPAGPRGSLMRVAVYYEVPNYYQGLAALFGGNASSTFVGRAEAFFRREGW